MAVGVLGYTLTGEPGNRHPTALIPVYFGVVLDICGCLAMVVSFRKHAMHVAAVIALLGVLGTFDGVIGGIKWLAGTPPIGDKKYAVISKLIMFGLCLILEALCVNSFIQARRARRLAEPGFPVNPIS